MEIIWQFSLDWTFVSLTAHCSGPQDKPRSSTSRLYKRVVQTGMVTSTQLSPLMSEPVLRSPAAKGVERPRISKVFKCFHILLSKCCQTHHSLCCVCVMWPFFWCRSFLLMETRELMSWLYRWSEYWGCYLCLCCDLVCAFVSYAIGVWIELCSG